MVDYVYWLEDRKPEFSIMIPKVQMEKYQSKIGLPVVFNHIPSTHKVPEGLIQKAVACWKDPEILIESLKDNLKPNLNKPDIQKPKFNSSHSLMAKAFGQHPPLQTELLKHMETSPTKAPISFRRPVIRSNLEGGKEGLAVLIYDLFQPYAIIK